MREEHDLNFGSKSDSQWYQLDCIISNTIALHIKTGTFSSSNCFKGTAIMITTAP